MPNSITDTVYIVEDDPLICKVLEHLYESIQLPFRIYPSGKEFLADYQLSWSGCLLLDVRLPHMSGLELQAELNRRGSLLPIIFLTGHADVDLAVRAMKAGAFDFMTKPFNNQALIEQTHRAMKKTIKLPPQFIEGYAQLTRREVEVLHKVVEGQLNKQIATLLDISISTVEMHRANLMRKLGANSIVELIKSHTIYKHLLSTPWEKSATG